MALNKFKNERKIIIAFLIVTIVIFGLSLFFLYSSKLADEMGGIFISAMIAFISGYGIIVFIKRLIKYAFLQKLQNAILVENVRKVSLLQEKFGKGKKRICDDVQFMINSGYLADLKLRNNEEISSDKEVANEIARERVKIMKQAEKEVKELVEKKEQKSSKKQVIRSQKCPNCGAKINFDETNEIVCPYCGNKLTRQ